MSPRTLTKKALGRLLQRILRPLGYRIAPVDPLQGVALEQDYLNLYREVASYTMTSPEAVAVLVDAVRYVVREQIPGAFVECGVWRGGSMMAVAKELLELSSIDRDLYLMDTFEGMTEPTDRDRNRFGLSASSMLAAEVPTDESRLWARGPLDQVREALHSVGYPRERLHFIKGRVEDTVPERAPEQIALLRLDTDWYESTRHELEHLYPQLSAGGVLIIDDYGCWQGAREATDEYFASHPSRPLFVRFNDGEGRIAVRTRT